MRAAIGEADACLAAPACLGSRARSREAAILKFLAKTALYGAAPALFARVRSARAQRGADVAVETPPEWQESGEVAARRYGSYAEYLAHQAEKYTIMLRRQGGLGRRALLSYRIKFFLRFRPLARLLPRDARIVCAGARDGTEVEVWRDLGFANAVGYDLNPGPDNPFVLPGDFNHLPLPDRAAQLYYTNAVDHAFDLEEMFREARRVIADDGYALFDISMSDRGRHEATAWKRPELVVARLIDHFPRLVEVRRWRNWMFVTLRGS